jgi:hypothetical protein
MIQRRPTRGRGSFCALAAATAAALAACGLAPPPAHAGTSTLTLSSTPVGKSLNYVGYNMAHYMPGSNTSAWVEYSNVNAFRVWASSSYYEPRPSTGGLRDDLGPWGDGVTSLSTFNARKTALRADPLNPTYINWDGTATHPGFNYLFDNLVQPGSNAMQLDYVLGQLHDRGIKVMQQTERSVAAFPINGDADWAGKWEQWQGFYAMAFHSARDYGVTSYQMYNEPNGDSNETQADYMIRLRLASDAIHSAIADVNRLYGKNLVADVVAPTTAGGAARVDDWGKTALQGLHTDYQGVTSPSTKIFDTYSVQVYGKDGASFGADTASTKSKISQYHPDGAAAGQAMPLIYSEFNRYTSNNLADMPTTSLETPSVVTDIGSIYVNAMANGADSMYAFKFSQTNWVPSGSTAEEPQKTGFHYVSETDSIHDITGATHASGVVRLVAKAFEEGRNRLGATPSTSLDGYDVATSFDPASKNYYLFGVNRSSSESQTITYNLSDWNVSPDTMVSVEEVSPGHNGEVTQLVGIPANKQLTLTQPTQSVWLLTIPSGAAVAPTKLTPSDDAVVRNADGASPVDYSKQNFGSLATANVGRTAASARDDFATYLKFNLGTSKAADVSRAILRVNGQAMTEDGSNPGSILFHVYALAGDNWNENSIVWDTAPGLSLTDAKLTGVGATAWPVGQLTFTGDGTQLIGIDLTTFLADHPGVFDDGQLTFALVREQRFVGDADNPLSFVQLYTKESGSGLAPQLMLFVPEPGTGGLLLLAGAAAFGRRGRRRAR